METKVNYAIVGLFVLVLATALIGGILWLSAGKQYHKSYDVYLTYMRESVSGLNLNAPVNRVMRAHGPGGTPLRLCKGRGAQNAVEGAKRACLVA